MTVRSRSTRTRFTPPPPPPSGRSVWLFWIDTLALLSWGGLLLKYWFTGQINLLLHPDYMWLANLAGLFLLGVGGFRVAQFVQWRQRRSIRARSFQTASTQHFALLPPGWGSVLLIGVALMGFVIVPRPFDSQIALERGVTDTLAATRSQPQSFRASTRPDEKSLIEWIRTLNVYPEPDAYTGQTVNVQGFVIHPPDLPDNYLMISRFILTCCAADAYPVGLPVKLAERRSAYPPDTWLDIQGKMITETLNGTRHLTIQPDSMTEIPEPKNPYEY
ncbi:MAG: TIGR03943 family putative permease subunit [Elainellaceae cyanobacterium]